MERRPNKINATLVMLLLSCVRSCLSSSVVVAFSSSSTTITTTTTASFQCSTKQIIHQQLIKSAVGDIPEDYRIQPTTNNNNNNDTLTYQICEAKYSDLPQAADLMTTGFYPELQNNIFMRPIRYLLELDRLQNNFPYDEDGRHYYLVAILSSNTNTTFDSGSGGVGVNNRKIIGFCDIDGRIPMKNKEKKNIDGLLSSFLLSLLSPFAITNVNRPQPYFSDLSIHSHYRRRGVASSLMKEAERRASCMGFDELYLGVRSTNDVALQMYSRYGYEFIVPQGDMVAFLNVQKGVRMLRRSLLDNGD